jgi:hypothetical protein
MKTYENEVLDLDSCWRDRGGVVSDAGSRQLSVPRRCLQVSLRAAFI